MQYLVATASVHVTAAAADHLVDRVGPDDEVVVVAVEESGRERDAGDALNVARSRLASAMPTTETRGGEPTAAIRAAVADHDPDVVVLGANRGTEDAAGLGSTARDLLADLDRPAVVVQP